MVQSDPLPREGESFPLSMILEISDGNCILDRQPGHHGLVHGADRDRRSEDPCSAAHRAGTVSFRSSHRTFQFGKRWPRAAPAVNIPGMACTASGAWIPKTRCLASLTRSCSCRAAALVGMAKYGPSTQPAEKSWLRAAKKLLLPTAKRRVSVYGKGGEDTSTSVFPSAWGLITNLYFPTNRPVFVLWRCIDRSTVATKGAPKIMGERSCVDLIFPRSRRLPSVILVRIGRGITYKTIRESVSKAQRAGPLSLWCLVATS